MTVTTEQRAVPDTDPGRVRRHPGLGSALRWEVRKLRAQTRGRAVLIGAALAPILVVFVIHGQSRPPKDTLFGRFATENGFALALLVLGFASQWVLPLLTAVVAGDVFASEDQHGTWKTVLTRSISRSRLFWAKTLTACGFAVLVLVVLATSTIASSLLIVGHQPLTGVSGQTIDASTALRLVALSWATMLPPMLGFTCLAIVLSVWSRNPAVGIAAPVVIGMVMGLVGSLGGIEAVRPLLLTTSFESWHGLLGSPHFTGPLVEGVLTCAVWTFVALAAAFVMLRRRDITEG
ncbi:MAG: transporter permease [Aeromicrobium sp.]|nr:transporter permease [Aeromicrobium sp.]